MVQPAIGLGVEPPLLPPRGGKSCQHRQHDQHRGDQAASHGSRVACRTTAPATVENMKNAVTTTMNYWESSQRPHVRQPIQAEANSSSPPATVRHTLAAFSAPAASGVIWLGWLPPILQSAQIWWPPSGLRVVSNVLDATPPIRKGPVWQHGSQTRSMAPEIRAESKAPVDPSVLAREGQPEFT